MGYWCKTIEENAVSEKNEEGETTEQNRMDLPLKANALADFENFVSVLNHILKEFKSGVKGKITVVFEVG